MKNITLGSLLQPLAAGCAAVTIYLLLPSAHVPSSFGVVMANEPPLFTQLSLALLGSKLIATPSVSVQVQHPVVSPTAGSVSYLTLSVVWFVFRKDQKSPDVKVDRPIYLINGSSVVITLKSSWV